MIVLERELIPADQRAALANGSIVIAPEQPVIAVDGAGAVDCLQGVLTNDVNAFGEQAFLYGAVLTPKGMIECDLWTARESSECLEIYPALEGLEALTEVFRRFFPPRLAKTTDLTEHRAVLQVSGPDAAASVQRAGFEVPAAGAVSRSATRYGELLIGRPPLGIPFKLQIAVATEHVTRIQQQLADAGSVLAEPVILDLIRVLEGWPRLGAEIAGKTLPQEVRMDELEGVSYTKGCYTGQETVARVHFRGHPNKRLVGLLWDDEPDTTSDEITHDDKLMGRVTTIAWFDDDLGHVGLGILRREVSVGERVQAAKADAVVADFPLTQYSGSLVG